MFFDVTLPPMRCGSNRGNWRLPGRDVYKHDGFGVIHYPKLMLKQKIIIQRGCFIFAYFITYDIKIKV